MWPFSVDDLAPLNCGFAGGAHCCWSDETVGWNLLSLLLRISGTIRRDCCYFSWLQLLDDCVASLPVFAALKGLRRKSASSSQIRMSFGILAANLEHLWSPQKTQNFGFASCTVAAFPLTSEVFLYHGASFLSRALASPWKSYWRPQKRSFSAFRQICGASHHLLRGIRAAWALHFWRLLFNDIKLFMMPTEFYPNLTATFILVAPWSLPCYSE